MIKAKVIFDGNTVRVGNRVIDKIESGYEVTIHKGFGIFNINRETVTETLEQAIAYCIQQPPK